MAKRLRDKTGFVYGWNPEMELSPDLEVFDDETGQTLEKEGERAKREEEDRRVAGDPDQHPDIQRNAMANTNVPPDPGRNYEHQVGAAALGAGEGHLDYPEAEENIVPHQAVFTAVVDRDAVERAEAEGKEAGTETVSVDDKRPRVRGRTVANQRVKAGLLEAAEQVKENPATDPEQGGGDKPVGEELPQPEKPANIVTPEEGEEVPNQGVRTVILDQKPKPGQEPSEPEPVPTPETPEDEGDDTPEEPAVAKRTTRRKRAS